MLFSVIISISRSKGMLRDAPHVDHHANVTKLVTQKDEPRAGCVFA